MSDRTKGVPEQLLEQGMKVASRAAKAVLDDPRGQEVVARALGAAQKGKQRLEEVQGRVLRAAGLPTKGDYEDVTRSMARLKRKLRELARRVDGERKR
ncbi:MAG: hypothetical protein WB493_14665 [Anaeromyxobacteraceae bacterium]